ESLEIESEQRLRVGWADVEVPVVELERDPVEMGDAAALCRVPLLQLLKLERDVRDRCVDLPRQEETISIWPQQLGQPPPAAGDELEHHEERHDAGVGLRELPEVVVGRDLAPEHRPLG